MWQVPNPETSTMRRFVEMVFEAAGHSPHLRAAPRWGIALAALFSPTLRAVKERLLPVGAALGGGRQQVRAHLRVGRDSAGGGDQVNGRLVQTRVECAMTAPHTTSGVFGWRHRTPHPGVGITRKWVAHLSKRS